MFLFFKQNPTTSRTTVLLLVVVMVMFLMLATCCVNATEQANEQQQQSTGIARYNSNNIDNALTWIATLDVMKNIPRPLATLKQSIESKLKLALAKYCFQCFQVHFSFTSFFNNRIIIDSFFPITKTTTKTANASTMFRFEKGKHFQPS